MEIAYTNLSRTPADWAKLCVWLDENCPGWMLANYHSNNIDALRAGSTAMVYQANQTVDRKIKTTKEQAVIVKLFHEDAEIVWSGEALSADVCVAACQMAEYNGYWREMPAELLGETTIRMIKSKLTKAIRREELRDTRRRAVA